MCVDSLCQRWTLRQVGGSRDGTSDILAPGEGVEQTCCQKGLGRGRFGVACTTTFVELPLRLQTDRRLRVECRDQFTYFIESLYTVHGVRVLGYGVKENERYSALVVQIKGEYRDRLKIWSCYVCHRCSPAATLEDLRDIFVKSYVAEILIVDFTFGLELGQL